MNKIVFFGNERIATAVTTTAPTLQSLVAGGYEVAAVVLAQGADNKSRKSRPLEIVGVAEQHGIPVLMPQKLSEIADQLAAYGADVGVLVAYGKLVPQSVIDLFPRGIINIHPSLLPTHRGSIPIEAAILHGDKQTGVSLMQLVREMDAGPTYDQQSFPLTGTETKQELADRLLMLGHDMLLQHLPAILDGSLEPTPQPEQGATYDQRLQKDAGNLGTTEWNRPAKEIERMIRALAGWPRVRTTLADTDIIITAAHAGPGSGAPGALQITNGELAVFAKDSLLVIDRLLPAGKKEMSAQAFLAGYKAV